MERTVENLKEMIRAGRGKIPAHKVIRGGQLVNVMSSEIYLGVSVYNERKYINPVRDENGEMVGYFERFERNLQK